tara:strand:+ start:507 stop:2198 length:1692 start_codon:yes stop_codon:yes gene_type:complete
MKVNGHAFSSLMYFMFISLCLGQDIKLKDIAKQSSLNFTHDHGGSGEYYYVESMGSGVCIFDYDNDGDLDAYFPQGSPLPGWNKKIKLENKLYRNDGFEWKDVTLDAGIGDVGYGMGCACGDYDNDGAVDLYVTNFGRDVFYRNNNDGTFSDITDEVGIDNSSMGMSAAFFDSDNDGWLDLYVTNYVDYSIDDNPECTSPMQYPMGGQLYARSYCDPDVFLGVSDKFYYNKEGVFIDRSNRSGIGRYALRGMGVITGDMDDDGDMDIYVANDKDMNLLFINNGKGRFTESALMTGTGYNGNGLAEAGMGVDAGDIDRNGWLDIFVTNYSGETNTLYLNQGNGLFLDDTDLRGLGRPSIHSLAFGAKFMDLDLDGWLDLYVANGHVIDNIHLFNDQYHHRQNDQVYLNRSGIYADKTKDVGIDLSRMFVSRGVAQADIDNDGDIDLFVSNNNDDATLLINEGLPRNNWIGFYLQGTTSNRDAIGSKITISTNLGKQVAWVNLSGSYLSSNDRRVVFGLGKEEKVKTAEIHWPGQIKKEIFNDLDCNSYYKVVEGRTISIVEYVN